LLLADPTGVYSLDGGDVTDCIPARLPVTPVGLPVWVVYCPTGCYLLLPGVTWCYYDYGDFVTTLPLEFVLTGKVVIDVADDLLLLLMVTFDTLLPVTRYSSFITTTRWC